MSFFDKARLLYEKSVENRIDESDMDTIIAWPQENLSVLFSCADQVRQIFFGNVVDPCSIMNIKSGNCTEDCAFCSQSAHNSSKIDTHQLSTPEEIIRQAENSYKHNLPLSVVSSGRGLSTEEIFAVAEVLKKCPGEKHASLGILNLEALKMLAEAGVTCYHHNLETSRSFFPTICTTHSWEDRIETIENAKKAGMRVCCGGILGLGETWQQRKEFCMEIRALNIDSVPLNFLNAIPGTRVSTPKDTPLDFLKAISLFRLAMPEISIKICGGRETNLGQLQGLMFYAGANGYISGGYLTTSGAGIDNDDLLIKSLGLEKREL